MTSDGDMVVSALADAHEESDEAVLLMVDVLLIEVVRLRMEASGNRGPVALAEARKALAHYLAEVGE